MDGKIKLASLIALALGLNSFLAGGPGSPSGPVICARADLWPSPTCREQHVTLPRPGPPATLYRSHTV
eukprot:UN05984